METDPEDLKIRYVPNQELKEKRRERKHFLTGRHSYLKDIARRII